MFLQVRPRTNSRAGATCLSIIGEEGTTETHHKASTTRRCSLAGAVKHKLRGRYDLSLPQQGKHNHQVVHRLEVTTSDFLRESRTRVPFEAGTTIFCHDREGITSWQIARQPRSGDAYEEGTTLMILGGRRNQERALWKERSISRSARKPRSCSRSRGMYGSDAIPEQVRSRTYLGWSDLVRL